MKRLPVRLTTTNLSQNLLHYHILQTEHSFLLSFSKRSGRSLAFFFFTPQTVIDKYVQELCISCGGFTFHYISLCLSVVGS